MSLQTIVATAGVTRAAALSHAPVTMAAHKRTSWPTATKSAFYANFYAVDEATGVDIG
jgi:hypothetical protein